MCAYLRQAATVTVAVLVLLGLCGQNASGQIVLDMNTLNGVRANAYNPMSAPTVQIAAWDSSGGVITRFSGFKSYDGVQGVGIGTTGHGIQFALANANFSHFTVTSRRDLFGGTEPIYTAASFDIHPGYGGSAGVGVDIGRMLLPAGSMSDVPTATIAPSAPTLGTQLWGSGTGLPVVGGSPLPFDGRMATFQNDVALVLSGNRFVTEFPSNPNYTLMGNATNGFSGGPAYDSLGRVLGQYMTATTPDFEFNTLISSAPHVAYLTTPVPEPSAFLMIGLVTLMVCRHARRARSPSQ